MPRKTKKTRIKKKIRGISSGDSVVSGSKEAKDLYSKSLFGEYVGKKIHYSLSEALYLVDKKKMDIYKNTRKMSFSEFMDKCKRLDKNIHVKFIVYKDLRSKGYLLKTALKFGADFRVYDRGVKPGEDHARWVVYPVYEGNTLTWYDFAAKNRVAHSTRKRLLIGVVDDENDVSYWECRWLRP